MNSNKKVNRWLILLASCFVTLCIGSVYSWSAFSLPLTERLSIVSGKEITNLSIVFTIANAVGPITMISGGYFNDKFGPKKILFIGGLIFGLGMFFSGLVNSISMLIITYGLGVGLGCGMIYGITTSNTIKFFPDKSGLIGGLITACYGSSSILLPPIVTILVKKMGITYTFMLIGTLMTIIICSSSLIIQKYEEKQTNIIQNNSDMNYKQMLKQSNFYFMLINLMCGAFAGMMVISQASQISQNMMQLDVASSAMMVSLIALFNTLGRLVSGTLSDRIGTGKTLSFMQSGSFFASIIIALFAQHSLFLFAISFAIIGFCFGGTMGIYPSYTAKEFGRKHNSVNYGIMFIGFALAGLFGPIIMNTLYQTTKTYSYAFFISAFLSLIGFIILQKLNKKGIHHGK